MSDETPVTPPKAAPDSKAATPQRQAGAEADRLMGEAESALASLEQGLGETPPGVRPFSLDDLAVDGEPLPSGAVDLVKDVDLEVRVELGRTHMLLDDVLKLRRGAVVALDKLAGEPVDVFVNGRLVARGEVMVMNDAFCVRVAELIAGDDYPTAAAS